MSSFDRQLPSPSSAPERARQNRDAESGAVALPAEWLAYTRDGVATWRRVQGADQRPDFVLVSANPAYLRLTGDGVPPGRHLSAAGPVAGVSIQALCQACEAAREPLLAEHDETFFASAVARWYSVGVTCLGPDQVVVLYRDITEHMDARDRPADPVDTELIEPRLLLSEARLLQAQAIAQIGSWHRDLGTGRVTWSPEMYDVYGQAWRTEGITPDQCLATVHPDDRVATAVAFDTALATRMPLDLTHRVLPPTGGVKHVRVRGRMTYDDAGRPQQAAGTAQDVTAEVQREAALRAAEQRLHTVFASMSEGMVIHDRDGRVVDANGAACDILCLTREQLLGRTSVDPRWEAVHEDGTPWPGPEHPGMVALRTGRVLRLQIMGVRAPGKGQRWISINASPLWADGGTRPYGCVATFNDVTERLNLKARLEAAVAELTDLYERAPCGYHSLDAAGRYQRINDTELDWLACSRDEVIGRLGPADFFTDEGRRQFARYFPQVVAGAPIEDLEFELIGRDGTRRWVNLKASTVRDRHGVFVRSRSVMHDVTHLRQVQALQMKAVELEAQNAQLRATTRQKALFLANMSHELRTPLNGVIGYAQLLQAGTVPPDSPTFRNHLAQIGASGAHLLQLIDALLDIARLDAGTLDIEPAPVDLTDTLRDVLAVLAARGEAPTVDVDLRVDPQLGELRLDPLRLRQVLANLIGNAMRFSHAGGRVEVRARAEGASRWSLEVEDHGIGIAAADLPQLFSPFHQLSSGSDKTHQGVGLGLSLVRRLVELQGGTVGVRSRLGEGSVFRIELPRAVDGPTT